jgi:hypothetical protein
MLYKSNRLENKIFNKSALFFSFFLQNINQHKQKQKNRQGPYDLK